MNKKKTAKKVARKNPKVYTKVAKNIYRTEDNMLRVRKMIDGVSYSRTLKTVKEAKAYLLSL